MTVLFTYFGVHILHTINRIQINPNNPGNVEDLQHSVEAHFMVFTISNITSFLYSYLFHLLLCYLILNFDSLFRLRYTVITIQTLTTFLHKRDIFHYNCGKRKKFLILPVFLSWKNTYHIVAYRCKVYIYSVERAFSVLFRKYKYISAI